jgi:hypothetical protein
MSARASRWVPIGVVLLGALVAGVTWGYGNLLDPSRAASIARLPLPSGSDVELDARSYAFSYALRNPPREVQMHLPRLNIEIVPPPGVADPEFREDPSEEVDAPNGDGIRRVAFVRPSRAGRYHVEVSSPDENSGALLIGELEPNGPAAARVRAIIVGGATLALALAAWLLLRRRAVTSRA